MILILCCSQLQWDFFYFRLKLGVTLHMKLHISLWVKSDKAKPRLYDVLA